MKTDFTPIQRALDRAHITMEEAGKLFPVTKQTLYNWRRGGPARSSFTFTQTCMKARLIERAVDMDLLPLPPEPMGKEERMKALEAKLREAYARIKKGVE